MATETVRTSRSNSKTAKRHDGVFGGYNDLGAYSEAFDEMFDGDGIVRGPYKGIHAELAPSDVAELEARAEALGRAFIDQGITFSLSGQERPFPLDLVPRVISAAEWTRLERGIRQRVKALEMYLEDIYTVPANMAGLPAISLPMGLAASDTGSRLPLGLQIYAPHFEEHRLLRIARMFEAATDFGNQAPSS